MSFEWDEDKAGANLEKHGVSFEEAQTVFDDPLYVDFHDPEHSYEEHRCIILGESHRGRYCWYRTRKEAMSFVLLAQGRRRPRKEEIMKKVETETADELRPEYDLRTLRVRRLGPGRKKFGNVIRLEPDVAEAFPDADSVNEALRFLIRVTKENRSDPQSTKGDT